MAYPRCLNVLVTEVFPRSDAGSVLRKAWSQWDATKLRAQFFHPPKSRDPVTAFREVLDRKKPDGCLLPVSDTLLNRCRETVDRLGKSDLAGRFLLAGTGLSPDRLSELLEMDFGDFVLAPFRQDDLLPRLQKLRIHHSHRGLLNGLKVKIGMKSLIGKNQQFLEQVQLITKVSPYDVNVLITGETGSGKEVFARAIHYTGHRSGKPFVPVNCGAIPVDLFESEVFGHLAGAFTGAAGKQKGLVEEASGGTLFLDEVDCLPLVNQVKLLRFIQEREYRPLGDPHPRKVDLRIIAAANTQLERQVERGAFRRDLFFRLNTVPIELPPLRRRREDIAPLARHFLKRYQGQFKKPVAGFSEGAMAMLMSHPWSGNVRELEQLVQRAVVLAEGTQVRRQDLTLCGRGDPLPETFNQAKKKVVSQFETGYLRALLTAHEGNISQAARAAGKNRRALWELIRKHHLNMKEFRKPR